MDAVEPLPLVPVIWMVFRFFSGFPKRTGLAVFSVKIVSVACKMRSSMAASGRTIIFGFCLAFDFIVLMKFFMQEGDMWR